MNIFDEVDENLFRPLTGTNKRKYVDILALIWDKCKRMPMYAIEKITIFDMVKALITKVRMDIEEMEAIMRTIDDRHIIYRTRAVQRAQFLLLSDGSVKSKINNILQYYASLFILIMICSVDVIVETGKVIITVLKPRLKECFEMQLMKPRI